MSGNKEIKIERWNEEVDGEMNDRNMQKKLKLQGYNFIKYTFSPGTDFPDHTHSMSKKDSIISGEFEFTMYGQTKVLKPGDMVDVPANTVHNARVIGSKSVTFFDATK
ncbi:hypothetical protein LOTGIDRAFT_114913 [Lottia gigantea]|uniref:Cupin type-2 domain-containing protein n=1 Tax=Lottia gigantea TaxID=225164 RepID=V4AJM3_LOTGI|nr:hypothetical protein LOTGIDRAFT_114913 [Lottia gigantea]ESO97312.1 hypothetical protein LOTGIDRAFT_114913 [Lottia gigantea]